LCKRGFHTEIETIGLLPISTYETWLKSIGKRARQDIKRSERRGVRIRKVHVDERFLRDAFAIYNETPIRQGRRYAGYGISLQGLRRKFSDSKCELLGAYDESKLIGLLWMMPGDRVAEMGSFVHLVSERHKLPTNALIAAAVNDCCERGLHFLVYPAAFGFQPGLDEFRLRMGFKPFTVPRYYVPLTRRGYTSIKLRIHRPIQYAVPSAIARTFRPIYNYISLMLPASVWYRIGGR
jgi:hypothetical protein